MCAYVGPAYFHWATLLCVHIYLVWTRTEGVLHNTYSLLLFHLLIRAHPSPWAHSWERMYQKEKGILGCPFFPSSSKGILSNISGWWMLGNNMSKEVFLGILLPSFCFWSKFWFKGRVWPLRVVSTPTYSIVDVTHLLCIWFEPHWTPMSPPEFRAHEASQTLYVNGAAHSAYPPCSRACPADFTYKAEAQR